ncbi:MAG: sterol desaturase family protein [Rhodospirillales bacterium]|nr:sterol desaturase family protein [Rhodospirillales bacterium]
MSKAWHWQPEVPLVKATPFDWPPSSTNIWRWFMRSWVLNATMLTWLGLAIISWVWLLPDMAQMATFQIDWIGRIFAMNFMFLSIIAGGLHTYFYILRAQDQHQKFEHRDMARGKKAFLFNDQVKDNMFFSLASGVTFWTGYEAVYFWAYANGYVPGVTFTENPLWFILLFVVIPWWSSFHFYWVHRLIHWPPLYKTIHALHHRNINVGPWSGISMHPLEHLLYFTNIAIHFVVASHPIHVLFHMYFQSLGPTTSHCGFANLLVKDKSRVALGDFFHQLHHRYFECNYGTSELPLDKLFGTYSDGTLQSIDRIRDLKRQKHH